MFSLFDTSTKLMLFLKKKCTVFVNLINIKSSGLFSFPHFLIPFMQQWNAKCLIALNFVDPDANTDNISALLSYK